MDKKKLTETDIITKYILPVVESAGWNNMTQIRQEVKLRDGKVIVRGQIAMQKTVKSADIVFYHKPSMPLQLLKPKLISMKWVEGMQQALDSARLLDVPFAFCFQW